VVSDFNESDRDKTVLTESGGIESATDNIKAPEGTGA
jgi:hypothetical protein